MSEKSILVDEEKNLGGSAVDLKTVRDQSRTLDGCPFTPAPWVVRAATFCDDGIPSFEVVMPGQPRMSAVDARVIGAAPGMHEALKKIYFDNEAVCGCECDVDTCCALVGEPCAKCDAKAALVLVNIPAMPRLDFVCAKCGVQQHAGGICANCGSIELTKQG